MILAVSHVFPPARAAESSLIAKTLVGLQQPVRVVSSVNGVRHNDIDASLAAYVENSLVSATCVGRRTSWIASRAPTRLTRFATPDPHRWANRPLLKEARRWLTQSSSVLTWSQWHSSHLVAMGLNLESRRWVAHFSDPWVANPFHPGSSSRANQRMERNVVSGASSVVVTTDELRTDLIARYPNADPSKFFVVPHAFEPSLYPSRRDRRSGSRLRLLHAGSFYGHRSSQPLIEALKVACRDSAWFRNNVEVLLVGNISHHELPKVLSDPEVRHMITVSGPVSYTSSLALMVDADGLLAVDSDLERNVFLPSKVVDYLGSGRPILALTTPGPTRRLIEEVGEVSAPLKDPSLAGQKMIAFAEAIAAGTIGAGPAAWERRWQYSAQSIGRRYSELLGQG